MYCSTCGSRIDENQKFCGACGQPNTRSEAANGGVPPGPGQPTAYAPVSLAGPGQPADGQAPAPGLVGFSPRINDPAFAKYQKNATSWSFLFAAILAVIAVIGFPIYGKASGEIDWPDSLYYGLGIGGMFLVIALIQTLRKGVEKTWDGVVVDKKVRKYRDNRDGHAAHWHQEFIIKIKKDSGGTRKHKWIDQPGLFGYYNVGDRVRHHKGFYYYEKYDKSRDSQIMCAACMAVMDISLDTCQRCHCPLLK
jgi:hypothetical protein